jgi:hypothetical protein
MKLIMENWRRYLNENIQLSKSTQGTLSFLLGGRIENPIEFLSRCKIVVQRQEDQLNFSLLLDGKVAGMVSYIVLDKGENCRPSPFQGKTTYMLGNIARDGAYKGKGLGTFISFLSACHVNNLGGTVTSDRDTSDKAGKQLVTALDKLGAKKSKEFDYVGYFIKELEKYFFDRDGNYKDMMSNYLAPTSTKTGIAAMTKGIHNRKLRTQFDKNFPELLKKVLKNLKPLTPQKDDDCKPSVNIQIGDAVGLRKLFFSKDFPQFLEKISTMSNEKVQDLLDSDERVQPFTFILPDWMLKAGKEIMSVIDASEGLSDEEKQKIAADSHALFVNVYDAEIGKHGRAKPE